MVERIWTIIAGLALVVAAVFLWRGDTTVAFVAATLGVVAWFLGLRVRLRRSIVAEGEAQAENDTTGERDEN